jgi:hypothetical protein
MSSSTDTLYNLFISYGRGDDIHFADKLYTGFTEHGYKVWFDKESLESNQSIFSRT